MDKSRIEDLAIFGGSPYFVNPLHVGRPIIGVRERFLARINDVLDRDWLTNNGPYVKELEGKIAKYIGVKHCIVMCNGTTALEIAIRAAGLSGEVIIPSFTFVATAHALQWQGITPVFCDVDPQTHNIDPARIEEMITPRTTGIIGVHLWGRACDIDALSIIAKKHRLRLLFDAAHAFGCSYKDQMIGGFGDAEVFSFHATKYFNSFEGGAVVTNDNELAAKFSYMKNFGFAGIDNVVSIGINGKMSEVSAAMGLTNLESLDEFISTNYQNYKTYQDALSEVPGIRMIRFNEEENHNYQYVVIEIEEGITRLTRDELVAIMRAENILARRYYFPACHRMEPYRSLFPDAWKKLPVTEGLVKRVAVLPTGKGVSSEDIQYICQLIHFCILHGREIHDHFVKHDRVIYSDPVFEPGSNHR